MKGPNKQKAKPVKGPSEVSTIQTSGPVYQALNGTPGAAIEEQSRGRNAVTESSKKVVSDQPVESTCPPRCFTRELCQLYNAMTCASTTPESSRANSESKNANTKDHTNAIEQLKTEPKIRDCNWEQFKNRFTPEECTFAIEVLLAGDDLDHEMEEEKSRRPTNQMQTIMEGASKKRTHKPQTEKRSDKERLERVRINSPAILLFLGGVTGDMSWTQKPHTFLRPFKTLIHFHDQLEGDFDKLKARFEGNGQPNQDLSEGGVEAVKSNPAEDLPELSDRISPGSLEDSGLLGKGPVIDIESPQPAGESTKGELPMYANNARSQSKPDPVYMETITEEGYKEIKCYMEFARSRILPTYQKFEGKDYNHHVKVRFDDLWSLFRTGDLVFRLDDCQATSSTTEADTHRSTAGRQSGQKLWRVYYADSDTVDWTVHNPAGNFSAYLREREKEREKGNEKFEIRAYYIDYNGVSYSTVGRRWNIRRFEGEKEVTKLELYPVRFEKGYTTTISKLEESGRSFQKLLFSADLAVRHDGWTLTHTPYREQLADEAGKTTEYIDSDVIIDFHEAYRTHPSWKPSFSSFTKFPFEPKKTLDEFPTIQWSGPDRSKATAMFPEVVVSYDGVASLQYNEFLDRDEFSARLYSGPLESRRAKPELSGVDFALLPSRMFAYSLRNRKFINAEVQNLTPIEVMPDPFNDLKIEETHKRLIRSVVEDHFDKKSIQRQQRARGIEPLDQDFIRGKDKGLVIMLHGAPGVGKTATAETVASAHRKPLFAITCGDLGIDPRKVESNLSEIFRLANLWDCILLLDEAEIFLSRREKKDDNLQRNALVSIFLRTLEYYPGILFLTTNRVGVLDEALNSRVHVSIHFRHLGWNQTMALFELNINRSKRIAEQRAASTKEPPLRIMTDKINDFARDNLAKHDRGLGTWWNGRQIRNAFQIATSLAYADAREKKVDAQRYLGREHFEQVLQAMEDYTQYRHDLLHKTDDDLAADREERCILVGGNYARRPESPRYAPVSSDYYKSRPFPYQRPPVPAPTSGAREFVERDVEYARQDPAAPIQEPFASPATDRRMSRGEFHDRGYQNWESGYSGRRM